MSKVLAKAFHMVVGVDLIGSRTSMSASRGNELEVTPLGIKAFSSKSGRTVLIPWTNIKGCELFPDPSTQVTRSEPQPPVPARRGRPPLNPGQS